MMDKPEQMHKMNAANATRSLAFGPFTLDLNYRKARLEGKQLTLPPCTFDYLVTLLLHSPQPVSYQALVKDAQGYNLGRLEAQDLARCRIFLLRKAVEPDPQNPLYIKTMPGYGYRVEI
jgi:DNA-binding response OmpR family regulator